MPDLRQQLQQLLCGRVCFMGLGNVDYGDDGFGVCLAKALNAAGVREVIIAGTTPERWIGRAAEFDHVIFLDAVEFGGKAGEVVSLGSREISYRFPQISTHKISLSVLAQWVEANGTSRAWLLGVQPESVKSGEPLSPPLQKTLGLLCDLLRSCTGAGTAAPGYAGDTREPLVEVNPC
jgi:hydrogenase maturation protease